MRVQVAIAAVRVTQVLTIVNHQSDVLQTNILKKSLPYHVVVLKVVRLVLDLDLDLDLCPLVRKNVHVKNGFPQVKNQVLGVSINLPNANIHHEDKEEVSVVAVVDLHHLIKSQDVIVQAVHVLLAVHRVVITPGVLVLPMALAVLCLVVVQSLDLHPYLGDEGPLAF